MSPKKLRSMLLPQLQDEDRKYKNIYIRARLGNGKGVGHVFASLYMYEEKPVVWITQLVVRSGFRNRGVAKSMLGCLRSEFETQEGKNGGEMDGKGCVGILSSHPFAVKSVLSVFGSINLGFIKTHAKDVMRGCPVDYVGNAKLRGSLFEGSGEVSGEEEGVVCCADTGFFVDHEEPERALKTFEEEGKWVLGSLPEGCEFLAIVGVGG